MIDEIVKEFATANKTMVLSPDELTQLLTDLSAEILDPVAKAAVDREIELLAAQQEADPPVFYPRGVIESGIAYRLCLAAEALAQPAGAADSDRLFLAAKRLRISVDPELPIRVDEVKQLIALAGGIIEEPIPDVPPVTLTPTTNSHSQAGGVGTFQVTVDGPGTSGTWTVQKQSEATWLTVDSPTTPQTESGPVSYTVAPGDGTAKTGQLYINGKTFNVVQRSTAEDEAMGTASVQSASYSSEPSRRLRNK
jgi:hypothetical protein